MKDIVVHTRKLLTQTRKDLEPKENTFCVKYLGQPGISAKNIWET